MILLPRDETDRNERDAEQINQRIALGPRLHRRHREQPPHTYL